MKKTLGITLIILCFMASACQLSQEYVSQNDNKPAEIMMRAEVAQAEYEQSIQMVRVKKMVARRSDFIGNARHLPMPTLNTESYIYNADSGFIATANDPLSTFSADVDTASYANIRRFINGGQMPPVGAVRIEEMINYFSYDYPQPQQQPIAMHTALGDCPWEPGHKLVQIGIQAATIDKADLHPANLVFLIDVSGSMASANKLGLLKKSMKMLVAELGERDRLAIVVYAGTERVVLESTSCKNKQTIYTAIDNLRSGGSTNGAGGIQAAYKLAEQGFMPKGNNRIILASDGDFNVGTTSHGELEKLIVEKRETGVFLTVLGFGMGNYHDSSMEVLADKGNGNYAYIDSLLEAKKVLVKEMGGTMYTIAKDVKLQVEFNPSLVAGYRLVGYKNRRLGDEDFNNDVKDAGEMGAGHSVTALYEIIPTGAEKAPAVDPLKYQKTTSTDSHSTELLTVKVRYKEVTGKTSKLLSHVLYNRDDYGTNHDFVFASAVAAFGLKLSESKYAGSISYQEIIDLARRGREVDDNGYRAEFIHLVEKAELMAEQG